MLFKMYAFRLNGYFLVYFSLAFFCIFASVHCLDYSFVNDTSKNDDCSILCSGEILQHVQIAKIFNDSKFFVDMKLRDNPKNIQEKFDVLKNKSTNIEPSVLLNFVMEWFDPPGSDLESVEPSDWTSSPNFIQDVYDKILRAWLKDLNLIWKNLLRKIPIDVETNAQLYSQIYLPNPFVVPGGRFTELYYWDSFWIVEGLLLCEMPVTAKKMIENLLHLVNKYGYVPNGSRKYYIGRSQIPFLIPIMELYIQYTLDFNFIKENVHLLHREYQYWLHNNSVSFGYKGVNYTVFHYIVNSDEPRPESYFKDYSDSLNLTDLNKRHFYRGVRAAAESGWDFSTRWFVAHDGRTKSIEDINTEVIAPVDLNSIMCYNARLLSKYYKKLGNTELAEYYTTWGSVLNYTISRLLWDDTEGFWFDFNLKTKKLEKGYYGSSFMPLWTKTYGSERNGSYIINRVLQYIIVNNLTSFPGGLPTSLTDSKQQWDLPNGWAPLHYIAVLGLKEAASYNATAGELALDLASKWVLNNYYSYFNSTPHHMLEKYDVTRVGVPGSGGEYPVQDGFGWSNGVVMKLLHTYPHSIRTSNEYSYTPMYMGVVLVVIMVCSLMVYFFTVHCNRRNNYEGLDLPSIR